MTITSLKGITGLGFDLVRGTKTLDLIESAGFPSNKFLFAGVVDGRNIWANDLAASLSTLQALEAIVGKDYLVVSTSCSLLHTAVDLAEKVTVVFPMRFKDSIDIVLATSFLQEFVEARRTAGLNMAPPCQWSPSPPLELRGAPSQALTANAGFVTFVIFPRHVEGRKLDRTVWSLLTFHAYVSYHVKCSEGFMHTRMRRRVESLIQEKCQLPTGVTALVTKATWAFFGCIFSSTSDPPSNEEIHFRQRKSFLIIVSSQQQHT